MEVFMDDMSQDSDFHDGEMKVECDYTAREKNNYPSMNELFDALAINSRESIGYVFSDNVDGFYSGYTHISERCGKYISGSHPVLTGYRFHINNGVFDRATALNATLLPYGVSHQYDNAYEHMSLISGQRLFSFTIESELDSLLAAEFSIGSQLLLHEVGHKNPELMVYELLDCPASCRFMALSSIHPLTVAVSDTVSDTLDGIDNKKIHLSSLAEISELTIYIGFSDSKEAAVSIVSEAIAGDEINQHKKRVYDFLMGSYFWSSDTEYSKAVMWARLASQSFVNTEFGYGIWAGFPWFKDIWGRDSFISLPGICLVNGQFDIARKIIENFATMQNCNVQSVDYGRIPNRVTSKDNIIYNTTDGTPWMIRGVLEYINHSGDLSFAKVIYPVIKRFIEGVEKNYLDHDCLMKHKDPDTWMDAKIEGVIPWSPRGCKANDIQALWFESIVVAKELAHLVSDKVDEKKYLAMSEKIKESFVKKFWDAEKEILADRINEIDEQDWSVRPNQLMVITIPHCDMLLPIDNAQHVIKNSINNLLFPWGICSLSQDHSEFHPYHDNQVMYHKDAAYHNGTIWGWNAGFTISALLKFNEVPMAYELSKNLAGQILHQGYRGTMSENLDAYQHTPDNLVESGTYSQAWSVAEYARNLYQDYIGYKPELLHERVTISPKLPYEWRDVVVRLPLGVDNKLILNINIEDERAIYFLSTEKPLDNICVIIHLPSQSGDTWTVKATLGQAVKITVNTKDCVAEGVIIECVKNLTETYPVLDDISFSIPNWNIKHQALQENNFLLRKRYSL